MQYRMTGEGHCLTNSNTDTEFRVQVVSEKSAGNISCSVQAFNEFPSLLQPDICVDT
jgi:hypothetical protein